MAGRLCLITINGPPRAIGIIMPFMPQQLAEKALQESRSFGVRRIPMLRPLGWLAKGFSDLRACPLPGLIHGLAMAVAGLLLVLNTHDQFWLLASAFSAFLIVAPVVATGLYAVSRAIDRGEPAGLRTALAAWHPRDARLVIFGLLLGLAATGWILTSAALITSLAHAPVRTPLDFIRVVVLDETNWLFEVWLGVGALLAAPVFASSVIAIPMLLDREIGILGAVFTSWRVVMEHPLPMAMWAGLIMALTLLGMATGLLGLIVIVPWVAHASWHAYRDLVSANRHPERR